MKKCADKGNNPYTIGLAYREQICETIPLTSDDRKLDSVLYEENEAH